MGNRTSTLLLLAVGIVLAGCDKGGTTAVVESPNEPPPLPPVESLTIDLSFFDRTGGGPDATRAAFGETRQNWTNAAVRVGVANAAVAFALAVPTATFAAAFQVGPVFDENTFRWHWRFMVEHGGLTYDGDLAGVIAGAQAAFEMRLSQASLGLTDFLWYEGVATLTGESGFWQFFHPEFPNESVGRIDWSNPSPHEWTLSFSATGNAENAGDVLTYQATGTVRLVTYVHASTGNAVEISWDAASGAGYIQADGYNDGAKSCWDGSQNDITCGG